MSILTIFLLILPLIDLTTSQIPNPIRYRLNVGDRARYAVDKYRWRLSSKIYAADEDPTSVAKTQEIYIPREGRTYSFKLGTSNPCIVNRGAFLDYIDYWGGVIKSWGGENRTYDKIIKDPDCNGACLTWFQEKNETAYTHSNYQYRLYVRKADSTPIKTVTKQYDLTTGDLISTTITRYTLWDLSEIPDSEYEFPADPQKTCYYA